MLPLFLEISCCLFLQNLSDIMPFNSQFVHELMMCRLFNFFELHVFLSLRSCHCNDGHFCLVVKPCALIFISLIVCETMMCHLFSFSKLHVVPSFKLSTLTSVQILNYSQAVFVLFWVFFLAMITWSLKIL